VVFLATELPQGVMSIATGLFDHSWNEQVFQNVGDFMDMLSLVNSAVNFGKYPAGAGNVSSQSSTVQCRRNFVKCLPQHSC
jgi:hypothetical protein